MKNQIKSSLAVAGLLMAGSLVSGGFLFHQNQQLREQLLNKKREAHNLELKLESYDTIKEEHAKLEGEGEELAGRFSSKEQAVDFIEILERAGEEAGVELEINIFEPKVKKKKSSKKDEKESGEKVEELMFLLDTKSDFNQLMDFLVKLENLERFCEVQRVSLDKEVKKEAQESGGSKEMIETEILTGKILVVAK